ncbi:MAG: GNAT family N-acetyltransferase [bacterium]|nr:GNAT family N-acetyltransferase [bacterium]
MEDEPMLMRANIENLTTFWKACGTKDSSATGGNLLHGSVSWPWRMWFDYDHHPDRRDLKQLLSQVQRVDGPVTIPQWHAEDEIMAQVLDEAGFAVAMIQEAMVARLSAETAERDDGHSDIGLRWATGPESAQPWTRVASESFGYSIDERVVAGLIGVPGFHLLLAAVDDAVVGTGLLVQTGQIAGLHMVGVPPVSRRRGYARQMTFGLLARARELGCEHATLQASAAGEVLYRQLGFEAQGAIRSFRKEKP